MLELRKISVVHLTSAHPRFDTRIYLKECTSLAASGYSVSLIVADGKGDEKINGISIYDVGAPRGRIDRIRFAPGRVFSRARELSADVYHLHDPELMPIGVKLRKLGKVVIFDAHEDVPKQLLDKPYLSKHTGWLLSKLFSIYERWACRKLNAVISATPHIHSKFVALGVYSVNINNYPLLNELSNGPVDWSEKQKQVAYVGGISSLRGISQVVRAMEYIRSSARLQLAGEFSDSIVAGSVSSELGWQRVDPVGFVGREDVKDILAHSVGGLVTFLPSPNHIDAQPNKMFEYMSAGVPVIGSSFPLWKQIIDGNQCGICVDPLAPEAIAEAIDYLISHPEEAEIMGRNGQKAVRERYNWQIEEQKLLDLYHSFFE